MAVLQVLVEIVLTLAVTWIVFVLVLAISRPKGINLSEAKRLVPDIVGLLDALASDPTIPSGVRRRLALLLAYLAMPFDLERGGVYVHCWGGIGRTGTVVGCVLADEGLTYDEIMTRLAELRRGSRKETRQAPEMPVQHDLIKR